MKIGIKYLQMYVGGLSRVWMELQKFLNWILHQVVTEWREPDGGCWAIGVARRSPVSSSLQFVSALLLSPVRNLQCLRCSLCVDKLIVMTVLWDPTVTLRTARYNTRKFYTLPTKYLSLVRVVYHYFIKCILSNTTRYLLLKHTTLTTCFG
jgi:hypothetical protein